MAKQKVTFINMLVYVLSKLYIRHNKIVIDPQVMNYGCVKYNYRNLRTIGGLASLNIFYLQ